MYEKKGEELLTLPRFLRRMLLSALLASAIAGVALCAGVMGYHFIARLAWVDALLNACMILTGMGPVDPMTTSAAKLFAPGYALFSGIVFLSAVGIVLAPVFHRIMHKFHLDHD
jgi:hypothetical protein